MTEANQPPEEMGEKLAKSVQARIARKVRENTKKLAQLTSVDSIRTMAPNLVSDELLAGLAEMVKGERYKDIKLMKLAGVGTATAYLCSGRYISRKDAEKLLLAEEIKAKIAEKVREDSEKLAKLTGFDSLRAQISGLERDKIEARLSEMVKDERYKDIRLVATTAGPIYLCSEKFITKEEAERLLRTEEIQARIAKAVREGSKNLAKKLIAVFLKHEPKSPRQKPTEPLTKADTFSTADTFSASVFDVPRSSKFDVDITEMLKDDRYQDIKSVATATGDVYLHSEKYITKNYAKILLGAEANDPGDIIAEMVREASKVFHRPTNTELFKEPVFNIDPDELETHIAHMLEQPEFEDIKLIHASTGARYLYSNLHMDEARAIKLAEWVDMKSI